MNYRLASTKFLDRDRAYRGAITIASRFKLINVRCAHSNFHYPLIITTNVTPKIHTFRESDERNPCPPLFAPERQGVSFLIPPPRSRGDARSTKIIWKMRVSHHSHRSRLSVYNLSLHAWYAQTDIDMAFRYRCNTHVLRNYKRYNIRFIAPPFYIYIYVFIYIYGSHSFIFILCSTFFTLYVGSVSFGSDIYRVYDVAWKVRYVWNCRVSRLAVFPKIRFLFSLCIDRIWFSSVTLLLSHVHTRCYF